MRCPECFGKVKTEFEINECQNCGIYVDIHKSNCDCIDCEEQRMEIKKITKGLENSMKFQRE